jgi:hypothetical protein
MTLDPVDEYKWLVSELEKQAPKNHEYVEALRKLLEDPASRQKIFRHVESELKAWANRPNIPDADSNVICWDSDPLPIFERSTFEFAVEFGGGCFCGFVFQQIGDKCRVSQDNFAAKTMKTIKKSVKKIIRREFGSIFVPSAN